MAIETNGDPWQPNHFECELNRHIIELSVWLYAELRRRNPGVFCYFYPKLKLMLFGMELLGKSEPCKERED